MISGRSSDIAIAKIDRQMMGFVITASDVQIRVQPSRIDSAETRLDVDVHAQKRHNRL